MDKQIEYDVRNELYNLNKIKIEEEFNKLEIKLQNLTRYELICYSLLSIEDGFEKSGVDGLINEYKDSAAKRTILEWFLKRLLSRKVIIREFKFDKNKYGQFEKYFFEISKLFVNHLFNEQLSKMRGINKILIEESGNKEYFLKLPSIKDEIDSQVIYYYGKNADSWQNEREKHNKTRYLHIIHNKYIKQHSPEKYSEFIFLHEIDLDVYSAFKDNIKVDIDKVGIDFSSKVIKSKGQVINVLAVFMYLSLINKLKIRLIPDSTQVISYKKENLIKIINKFMKIGDEELNNLIDYLTIDGTLGGGLNEYPLINIHDNIFWIPSSFFMNDFQFSIVNGHYDKNIIIENRDSTVSQSVVDAIVTKCNYKNIVKVSNKLYFDKMHKYNGKDLKSDIDVGLYDEISNCLLIIECKWKENLFFKGNRYDLICDAVNKIYSKQLNKHKYFLELDQQNLDYIFDNSERVKNRPYYPQVLYIFVDKRIQLHYEGMHALSEFDLLKILSDNSYNDILKLDEVILYIKTLNTKVDYDENHIISSIKLGNKVIKNSVFTLDYR